MRIELSFPTHYHNGVEVKTSTIIRKLRIAVMQMMHSMVGNFSIDGVTMCDVKQIDALAPVHNHVYVIKR